MEQLPNGLTLEIPRGAFPLSTDSMALAHFARLPRNAHVLDLGSGCGTLGLLLCARDSSCRITGIELDPLAHQAALANIARNALDARMESICSDLRQLSDFFSPGQASVCISNPPYFSGGPDSRSLTDARKETCCTLADLMAAADHGLKYGGDFYAVYRPDRMMDLLAAMREAGIEPKRLCLVHPDINHKPCLLLVSGKKGGKAGCDMMRPLFLTNPDGTPTADAETIYETGDWVE